MSGDRSEYIESLQQKVYKLECQIEETRQDLANCIKEYETLEQTRKPKTIADFIRDLSCETKLSFSENGGFTGRVLLDGKLLKYVAKFDSREPIFSSYMCEFLCCPYIRIERAPKKWVADYLVESLHSKLYTKETHEVGAEPFGSVMVPGSRRNEE